MKKCLFCILVLSGCAVCLAFTNKLVMNTSTRTCSCEVSPGKFIKYRQHLISWDLKHGSFTAVHLLPMQKEEFFHKDTFYLSVPWDGVDVFAIGVGVPISLRSHEGKLYMIVFDRETDFSKIRFRYYRQDQNILAEIRPHEYPKAIATENLWLYDEKKTAALKKLDPDDGRFQDSLTAQIWCQLEQNKEYYETRDTRITSVFLREYLAKYNVERLEKLVQ